MPGKAVKDRAVILQVHVDKIMDSSYIDLCAYLEALVWMPYLNKSKSR